MRFTAPLLLALAVLSSPTLETAPVVPNDDTAVTHALNRLAFGPRPGDVDRVRKVGLDRWIDSQLTPEGVADDAIGKHLERLTMLAAGATGNASDGRVLTDRERRAHARRLVAELAESKLLRSVYSERQLQEVLVDFWFNHFNVYARKGQTAIYIAAYERDAIRPHVLGTFRDLLGATAKSPAMLLYLDNARSRQDGLNENYARELLELHTLGVDGGYSQEDVVNVARAFTGWTIGRRRQTGLRFVANAHDRDPKTVLGHTINAGGMADGERVLDLLAKHPATARHIATKLAQRFVSDTPPKPLVDRAATKFQTSGGDLREVVRTIVTSPEFFDTAVRYSKVKTPFEFVTSALRATAADVRNAQPVVRAIADMGMPLYLCQPPTGYDDSAEAWVSSGTLVSRINFAVQLSRGEVGGIHNADTTARPDALTIGSAQFPRQ